MRQPRYQITMTDKLKILLVDDLPENLFALEQLLEELDVDMFCAADGNEAVREAFENDFDLILMDIQMPGMNGFEAVNLIKKEERNRFIPVIFLTAAFSDDISKVEGIKAGAIDFMTKPISEEILIGKVKLFLEMQENKKELIKAKEALEKSEAQKLALLNNSPDMIEQLDTDNKIVWANKTSLDMFSDAIGRICLFTDSDKPCDNCLVKKTLKTGKLEKGIFTIHKTKNSAGEQHWSTIAVPLKDHTEKVYGVLKISRDITERILMENQIKKTNQELEKIVFKDSLTGSINRKPFMELLEKNIIWAKRDKKKLALLFMDLEKFKQVNDLYGHDAGDKILIKATKKIKTITRENDFVGRIGGDEFVLCLNGIKTANDAVNVARKINEVFSEKIKIEDKLIDLTVSIGISIYPLDGDNADTLLKNSDIAMYKAKKTKKNTFQLYNKNLHRIS